MERKNTLLLTVIAIATLLVAVVGATFAYFATQMDTNTTGLNVNVTTEPASAIFLASGSELTLEVLGANMQRSQTDQNNAVLSNNNTTDLVVTYGATTGGSTLSCTYDIVFKWTNSGENQHAYKYSEATHPTEGWATFGKEFTLKVGTATVAGFNGEGVTTTGMPETNIATSGTCKDNGENVVENISSYEACKTNAETNTWTETNVMTLVHDAVIKSNTTYVSVAYCSSDNTLDQASCPQGNWVAAGGGTTVTWPIEIAFYNLPLDQNHLAGKSFIGRIEVANVVC